jgi:hypothetical protein
MGLDIGKGRVECRRFLSHELKHIRESGIAVDLIVRCHAELLRDNVHSTFEIIRGTKSTNGS